MSLVESLKAKQNAEASEPMDVMPQPTTVVEAELYNPPKGSYRAIRLPSVVLKNGTRVIPNSFGYYEVKDNDELKTQLEYYDGLGRDLVELVK